LQNDDSYEGIVSRNAQFASVEMPRLSKAEEQQIEREKLADRRDALPWSALLRIACYFGILIAVIFLTNAAISAGLRRLKTSAFGAENQIMQGKVNAQVVIAGSSRAVAHYDPRTLEAVTGRTAFNIGRNGEQTDMQVAFLKAYLGHNQKPEVVIFNLDAFSFLTSQGVFEQVDYTPYIDDPALYDAIRKINPNAWKSRYIPLYGYVVEDMNFTWILGLKSFFGWTPREDYFLGFNPRARKWTTEFENLKASKPDGVRFEIETAGVEDVKGLIQLCQQNGIQLIFVYSPEYIEMQALTNNRQEVFGLFRELSTTYNVPFWNYSGWEFAGNKDYFQNSQHLNSIGAEVFSDDLAKRLKEYFEGQSKDAGSTQALGRSFVSGSSN
jgi:hypothetical protein